ncbi:hypothetical protein SUGI_0591660 [Cryptomeria japonica]|uniref:cyclin-dependent protein kinase inhibitor SMR6 n=1 Tax=Cryptomeria japonica TaxID=3369 RepID=UPI00241482D2|nr:cyclin-dependent protein kinase inhibitor SMR6 [Cryptomeria japonica]GLJ29926.1 hypothetical protein SUGI_0591660 [Cryptomeria japonica]
MGIGKRKAESDSFDSEDIGFPSLKPVLTVCPKEQPVICSKIGEEDCFNGGCETPKCQENKIPECLECPPAPRKPKPRAKRKPEKIARDFFFVPADLDSVFFPYQILRPRKKIQWSSTTEPGVAIEKKRDSLL